MGNIQSWHEAYLHQWLIACGTERCNVHASHRSMPIGSRHEVDLRVQSVTDRRWRPLPYWDWVPRRGKPRAGGLRLLVEKECLRACKRCRGHLLPLEPPRLFRVRCWLAWPLFEEKPICHIDLRPGVLNFAIWFRIHGISLVTNDWEKSVSSCASPFRTSPCRQPFMMFPTRDHLGLQAFVGSEMAGNRQRRHLRYVRYGTVI